jgi:hypothetical protein
VYLSNVACCATTRVLSLVLRKVVRAFARRPTLATMRPSRRWGTQICCGLDLGWANHCGQSGAPIYYIVDRLIDSPAGHKKRRIQALHVKLLRLTVVVPLDCETALRYLAGISGKGHSELRLNLLADAGELLGGDVRKCLLCAASHDEPPHSFRAAVDVGDRINHRPTLRIFGYLGTVPRMEPRLQMWATRRDVHSDSISIGLGSPVA